MFLNCIIHGNGFSCSDDASLYCGSIYDMDFRKGGEK